MRISICVRCVYNCPVVQTPQPVVPSIYNPVGEVQWAGGVSRRGLKGPRIEPIGRDMATLQRGRCESGLFIIGATMTSRVRRGRGFITTRVECFESSLGPRKGRDGREAH